MAVSTIGASAFERGTREGSTRRNYSPEDFFFPVLQGIGWPLFVLTTMPYKYGIYKRDTKLALNRKKEKLLRELEPHMDEVEKMLAGKIRDSGKRS